MLTQLLNSLGDFAASFIAGLGYPGIVLVMILENIFPPIPSELIMPFAGFLVTEGQFSLALVILFGTLGSIFGAIPFYYLGYYLQGSRFRAYLDKYGKYLFISLEDLERAEDWFKKYGEISVLIARVIPLVRSFISIPAGFVKMSPLKFFVYTGLGTLIWTTFLTLVGVVLGENWRVIGPFFRRLDYLVVGMFIVLFSLFYLRRFRSTGKG